MKSSVRKTRSLLGLLAAAALAGCAAERGPICPAGETPLRTARLYLGPRLGAGSPNEADLRRFIAEEMTPRFPDGLTVMRGGGVWRGRDEALVRGSSRVVQVVLPQGPVADARLDAVRSAYRVRFRQDPVLHVAAPSCMEF